MRRWRSTLRASKDEALLALELQNSRRQPRRVEAFYVQMQLAWLYLLHAKSAGTASTSSVGEMAALSASTVSRRCVRTLRRHGGDRRSCPDFVEPLAANRTVGRPVAVR
jgi:hypothetical protein